MPEDQSQQTTTFFPNPLAFLWNKYQSLQDEKLARKAVSQNDYFINEIRWIAHTQSQLLICGYDKPFMKLKETQEELAKAARGKGYYRKNGNVVISAIMPSGLDCGMLEELADETVFFSILRTDRDLSKGYLVHDEWGVNLWDSNQLTPHPKEKDLGVIKRYATINDILARKMISNYQELKQQIQH